eukprot:CAMPEP_0195248748 /NCGR_PEP_ID=MMETSP0706-20130129/1716_1 /TAXON_ID=33640 /ORGANISM="Asterionellopsis glacialis, Strain CCMP134" /LENGTH=299 /DNA_ID=CAMNT_0040300441 /DNA_START=77 /DNA_END=973 /DNA_ORIENTATION=+
MSTDKIDISSLEGKPLIELEDCLKVFSKGPVFIDGSWFLKGRNARKEYEQGPRIEGARFFDIDDIASKGELLNPKSLPHMMPPKKIFAAAMDALSITNNDHLIVYGSQGCLFPHRTWYQLRAMGHPAELVHFMQGSIEDWKAAGGPIDETPTTLFRVDELDLEKEPKYVATDAQNVVDIEAVKQIVKSQDGDIMVDVRAADRFKGLVEEPRPNMRLGHMPGALNIPFTDLLDPDNISKFKSKEDMRKIISDAGLDINTSKRVVCSCGSGASACALALALDVCGRDPRGTFIYDGSWSEW